MVPTCPRQQRGAAVEVVDGSAAGVPVDEVY
ncbi:hypothetical protein N801_07560 [Knoellia aerolata DSM 18566]|uniref:Uncharacterized protein n=1 Tax=Knoellia aerolata DSM 18566 TaxID=1385519 RepID=A0A0A0JW26_9MICO|nr:hypothetical protein N801_07560 [Knoellia aerolata DSM 18566]